MSIDDRANNIEIPLLLTSSIFSLPFKKLQWSMGTLNMLLTPNTYVLSCFCLPSESEYPPLTAAVDRVDAPMTATVVVAALLLLPPYFLMLTLLF